MTRDVINAVQVQRCWRLAIPVMLRVPYGTWDQTHIRYIVCLHPSCWIICLSQFLKIDFINNVGYIIESTQCGWMERVGQLPCTQHAQIQCPMMNNTNGFGVLPGVTPEHRARRKPWVTHGQNQRKDSLGWVQPQASENFICFEIWGHVLRF